jgi:hypothetical protein
MARRWLRIIGAASVLVMAAGTWSQADVLCRNKKGVLAARSTCKGKETQIDPAALGLIGPKGDTGDPGPGARWVLVRGDGTIASQSGGITVARGDVGEYYVGFGSSLEGKTLSATVACLNATCKFSGAPQANICGPGAAGGDCAPQFDDPSFVGVFIQNTTQNALEDVEFHLAVF